MLSGEGQVPPLWRAVRSGLWLVSVLVFHLAAWLFLADGLGKRIVEAGLVLVEAMLVLDIWRNLRRRRSPSGGA